MFDLCYKVVFIISYLNEIKKMECTVASMTSNGQAQKHASSIDSPLQIKLVNFLGLKSYLLDKFVFKRKPSSYRIRQENKTTKIFCQGHQIKLQGYSMEVVILQYHKKNQSMISKYQNHSIPAMRFRPLDKSVAYPQTIIYAHGNASDMVDSFKYIQKISKTIIAEYIVFDYTAYGESRKQVVGQQIICGDLQIVIAWACEKKPITSIILWGFSLGTFPVVFNAAKYNVKGVILQCPIASVSCFFKNVDELFTDIKFKEDYFANIDYISKIKGKMFIMHSQGDQIIPFCHAKLLFDKYIKSNGQQNISFIQISKLSHNSLHKFIVSPKANALKQEFLQFMYNVLDDETFAERTYSQETTTKQRKKLREIMNQMHYSQVEEEIFNEDNYQLIQSHTNKGKFVKSTIPKNEVCFCFKNLT